MANIDTELDTIKKSPRGDEVRQAIINAINKIVKEREYPPTTVTIKTNGTKEGGPWNKVIVDVPEGGVDVANIDNLGGTITENGYYKIQTLKDLGLISNPNCIGIDGFSVDVSQRKGEYGEITITENGTYDPLLDGYDGYSKVYVNVLGGEIKDNYTVRFFDGKRLLEAKSVPRGTNATYTGTTALSGSGFVGWNPNPVSVSRDMDCYAVYAGGGSSTLVDKYTETIGDTWAQIIEKMKSGRPYDVGSTKKLVLTVPGGGTYILNMCLVGYGSDLDDHSKYVSTWMNINNDIYCSTASGHIFGEFSKANSSRTIQARDQCHGNTIWWGNSLLRALLNGDPSSIAFDTSSGSDDISYYNAIASANALIPTLIDTAAGTSLFKNIKKVTKYTFWYQKNASLTDMPTRDMPTEDRIWLPSTRELYYPQYANAAAPNHGPFYTIKNYMCTKGAAEKGGTNQYGNPMILSTVIAAVNTTNSAFRTRDNTNSGGTTANDGSGFVTLKSMVNASYNPSVWVEPGGSYQNLHDTGAWLPISFCL